MRAPKSLHNLVLVVLSLTAVAVVNSDVYLEQEIIGKCQYYQTAIYTDPFQTRKNCTLLWELFRDAFAYQSKCNVSSDRYRDFIEQSQHPLPDNKFIFWENVYTIVMRYSNRGLHRFSIADTLTGFIGDSMKWCGNKSAPDGVEQNRNTCPGYDVTPDCPSSAEAAFWTIASAYYARRASGDIDIMMNAESSQAFTDDSYFALWELPNLNSSKVTSAKIILAKRPNQAQKQRCSGQSILLLQQRLGEKGISSTCVENPRDLQFMLCADTPSAEDCQCEVTSGAMVQRTHVFLKCTIWIMSIIFVLSIII